ncbi:SDR family oxidoreductase [Streptomyces sp. TX20-6-3]|uniref:SDR family oxidoreductase n=1 Tax=Streptomyces sp. TX20-6-3 TaxID=3028705 RepID=UPI0029AE7E3B|nr:SDR family oxidoreductase [Streptomyces sp. TX20-6-3]MDX2564511.1 SDR family oxidoreductase [Streptomyces sp. TX20-6-3]
MEIRTRTRPLRGRTVVVTGAARGLGAALSRALDERGARVALLGLERPQLEEVAASLRHEARCWETDVTDDAAMAATAQQVRAQLGPASAVVANAGVAEGGPFADSDPAVWRRVIEVNLIGSAATARSFLPDLFATQGYYLQITSLAAMGTSPLMSAYCASKSGAESFAHALRAEVAHQGVAVGIAYLNWIDTDMVRDADRHAVLRELRAHMPPPARRVRPADQVAERLATAVERRSAAVYVPAWLRAVQLARPFLPPLVTHIARTELPRLERSEPFGPTGLLGAGGQAAVGRPGGDHDR